MIPISETRLKITFLPKASFGLRVLLPVSVCVSVCVSTLACPCDLKKSKFLVLPLPEIHNHHITTREPWVLRLLQLHSPDRFMVSILLYAYIYIPRPFHSPNCFSLNPVHVYWSRQPRVFQRLTSLLSWGSLNTKMSSYQYRDPHDKDKTVSRQSYL